MDTQKRLYQDVPVSRIVEEEYDREMYNVAALLGSDAETADVGFAFSAQSEVVLGHE